MRGAVLYGPRDIRFEDRETPKIVDPTDAVIRISATCVRGSDLWPYRRLSARFGRLNPRLTGAASGSR
jgi:threonine dehydrogenase-like Zn-dependent dehydrogenase